MILSDNEIIELVKKKDMIHDFDINKLQAASYDVSICKTIHRFKNDFRKIHLNETLKFDDYYEKIDISLGYDLKPNETIFFQIKEKINMPNNIIGKMTLRNSFIRIGLCLNAPFINPTYSGNLNLSLINNSPFVIEIIPNIILAQIIFEKISKDPDESRLYKNKKDAKFHNENSFNIPNLSDDINKNDLEGQYEKLLIKIRGKK